MTKRLNETYQIGQAVEAKLEDGKWWAATVLAFDGPGMWVKDRDGRYWFVTNTRHIRKIQNA
jgi:hypothetical protein